MAIEPAPDEINLREPRKRGRDFSALLWLCGWGVATAVALSALVVSESEPRPQLTVYARFSQSTNRPPSRRCLRASPSSNWKPRC